MGQAWLGDAVETLEDHLDDESVDLIVTSPPFALQRPKEYGNESQDGYVEWFMQFADEFWRVLKPTGSLVIDLGDDDPLRYERAAVRWLSRYTAADRQLRLAEACALVDLLDAVGRHDQVAVLRLERWLRARGFGEEAGRVA
jgi:hypothetical protein